ncbi:MAG: iron chaperone [Candidatus Dormibacterales bacterium]
MSTLQDGRATIGTVEGEVPVPATKKPPRAASEVFTAEEKAAMKELVKERKASSDKAEAEADCLAKIAEMPPSDRKMAERLHKLIASTAPQLAAKTWYGMPAYTQDGNVVCFFQSAEKFKARYATLGFTDRANLEDGEMWPTCYALKTLTAADEAKIAKLVKRAVTSGS